MGIAASEWPDFIRRMDPIWFADGLSVAKARAQFNEASAVKVSAPTFSLLIQDHCRFFKQIKRKKPLVKHIDLSYEGWDRLKIVAEQNLSIISSLTLDQVVVFLRHAVPCNKELVKGLPSRFHVWKKKSA